MRANIVLLLALMLGGCAMSSLQMAPPAPDQPWSPAVDAPGALSAKSSSGSAPPSQGYVLPPNPAAASLPAATIDSTRIYNLADLIDLAESSNPETRIAWNDARNAALTAGMARSAYLPRISAAALAGRESSFGSGRVENLALGQGNNVATGTVSVLSIDWLLFDFGRRDALIDVAEQGTVIANVAFTGAHQKLIHAVSMAFYTYSAARARADSAVASLKDAQEIQVAAESRKKRGVGTVIEVAQARQFTAQAKLASVRAEGDQADAYVALLSAIGISPLSRIRIAEVSSRPLPADLDQPIEKVLESALQRRPDVLAAIAAQKAAYSGVRAAKGDFLPKVFVSASGTHSSGNFRVSAVPAIANQTSTVNLSNRRWGTTVMMGVTVPLYSGGVRDAALAQARNRADSAEDALQRVRLGAAQEVVMANSKLRTSLAAVAAARALLEASQTTYDAALAAYRRGVGTSTDVLAAERQLLEARDATADTHSAALAAAATLALACGSLGASPN